ncbi:putative acyl transferase [Kluyvera cryocrescens]|uniref:Putative acyl transferase n=1 Tax=Kluyvera cryocrescens TaxID=580 RepID=A0A485D2D5_KLUCR|nr:putative acyl transferase [Kluyvera cryocrescens]
MATNMQRAWREIADAGALKSKLVILLYRMSTLWRSRNPLAKLLGLPFVLLNKLIAECLFSVEIPHHARIGYGLKIFHPARGSDWPRCGDWRELHAAPGRDYRQRHAPRRAHQRQSGVR